MSKNKTKIIILLFASIMIFAGYTYYCATAPPAPVLDEDHIIINKTTNNLYFFRNRELIKKYEVSTGKTPELTPEGRFKIVNMQKDPHGGGKDKDNPFGSRWMGLQIPGHEDGLEYGIHGTDTPETIGEYETNGCIRMNNNDAKELYGMVETGTPVIIISYSMGTGYMKNFENFGTH